ncbi:MAG TPA: tRNA pseudouridine(55) synthase TruB [Methylophilaceae bacterium]|jgi:tRNA pseudouridine55 synthase
MQFKRIKREINGVLLLDKPPGYSSNQALQIAKRIYSAAKAGHTGNLDPFATGLLPLCLGEATKFSQTLLDADKEYSATLKLGATSNTGDTEGEISTQQPVQVSQSQAEQALRDFTGDILQIPPMHSALKYQGKALYEYARAGVEIERKPRPVTIKRIALTRLQHDEMEITVTCSKGTYIRVLAEDIGKALGCGAYLTALRRLTTGGFSLKQSVTLPQLEQLAQQQRDDLLLPVDALLSTLPTVTLDEESAHFFCQGQSVWKSGMTHLGMHRVYAASQKFLGVGDNLGDGQIAPKRIVI